MHSTSPSTEARVRGARLAIAAAAALALFAPALLPAATPAHRPASPPAAVDGGVATECPPPVSSPAKGER